MKPLFLATAFLCLCSILPSVYPRQKCPLLHAPEGAEKTGCYLVLMKEATPMKMYKSVMERVVNVSEGNKLYGSVQRVAMAFSVKLSTSALHEVRSIPEIQLIEEETMAVGTQSPAPWHTDRIDQGALPLDARYDPIGTGEGVDIYILDTGIWYEHEEYESRAKYSGYDPTDVYNSQDRRGRDCHGHGSHVSSLAGSKTFGSAKKVNIYSVRVLGCNNAGAWSVVLDGLEHALESIQSRNRPAVISMSLSGGFQQSVENAVQRLHSLGITIVVAAGNAFDDACRSTPAGSNYVITVGGTAIDDNIYFITSYGSCVDIFAPGSGVLGVDHLCDTCTKFLSGTSMACPIVSGAAAILLSQEPFLTPDEVKQRLVDAAVDNAIDFRLIPFTFRPLTPNKLLQIPGSCGGVHSAASAGTIQSPGFASRYPSNLYCKWTIKADANSLATLNFLEVSMETPHDVIRVCNGDCCTESSLLAELTGVLSVNTLRYQSRGSNILTVEMATDGTISNRGFRASFSSVPNPEPVTGAPPTIIPIITPPTSCPPIIVDNSREILEEAFNQASVLLNAAITETFEGLLEEEEDGVSEVGLTPDHPARSCLEVAASLLNSGGSVESGLYYLRNGNGPAMQIYCDLTTSFKGNPIGWMKLADVDMTNSSERCPSALTEVTSPAPVSRRLCGRSNQFPGCTSVIFPTFGISYSKVCGRVIGYQFSSPNAFYQYQLDNSLTLEDYYVDGISITHGNPGNREHIWTFAGARGETETNGHICPCTNTQASLPSDAVPTSIIGTNYFCETGAPFSPVSYVFGTFYDRDALWDGRECGSASTCCGFNDPPWFCVDLPSGRTSDDIELRVCSNEADSNEDTPLEAVEIYAQ